MPTTGIGAKVLMNECGEITIISPFSRREIKTGENELNGITDIKIKINPREAITADIELFCHFEEIQAIPNYIMINPKTGNREKVLSVKFESGEEWKSGE
jgi:hypothetical protein